MSASCCAISAPNWQAGWWFVVVQCTCIFYVRVDGAYDELISHMFQRIELIVTLSIALDTIFRIILFYRRGPHCSARGGVAAKGTSCMHGPKKCRNLLLPSWTRIKNAFANLEKNISFFFFHARLLRKTLGSYLVHRGLSYQVPWCNCSVS